MKFKSLAPVPLSPPNTYMVEITTCRGDADGYSHFMMGPFKEGENEDSLQCLLETLRRAKERYPNGRLGNSKYSYENGVLGFVQWFGGGPCSTVEELRENYPAQAELFGVETSLAISELVGDFFYEDYPAEALYDGGVIEEDVDKYEVFYYDSNSVKHTVEVDWEEN